MAASVKTTAVEFVGTTKIGEKGQLTVPKQFREDLALGAGAPVDPGPIRNPYFRQAIEKTQVQLYVAA